MPDLPSIKLRVHRDGNEYVATAAQLVRMAAAVGVALRVMGGKVVTVRPCQSKDIGS